MKLYEITHIPDKTARENEDCIAKKVILKAKNEVEAIKRVAVQIQPYASHLILKLEGDIAKIRERLLTNFELCLVVSEVNQ